MAVLALRDAIVTFRDPEQVTLKWPNDLLYNGGKSAGLLLEVEGGAVLLGCGVNLNIAPDDINGWRAGSLNGDGHVLEISADMLMEAFAERLIDRYNEWTTYGFSRQRQDWQAAAAHLGQILDLDLGGGVMMQGQFTGLNDDGSLCLMGKDGINHRITAADVVRARLAIPPNT
jgi:BirA family biotin operon repressor/biotin-[acetyl-CoA-carboxylase] ligase